MSITPEPGKNLPLPAGPTTTAIEPRAEAPLTSHAAPPAGPAPYDGGGLSIQHYLDIVLRRKWLVLAIAGTILLLQALQVYTTTPLYRATAKLQIDPEGNNILPYEEVDAQSTRSSYLVEYVWTQTEKLQASSLNARVAAKLAPRASPDLENVRGGLLTDALASVRSLPSRLASRGNDESELEEAPSLGLWGSLQVRPLRNTRLIEVAFESPDPDFSSLVANTVSEEFIEQHLESKFDATTRATDFLAKQLEDLQIRVEKSEADLVQYARANNIVNVNERDTIARKTLSDLSDELTSARSELIVERARYAALPQAGSGGPFPDLLKTEALHELDARLSELESQMAGLASQYGSSWPAVKTLREQITELERQIEGERAQAIANVRQRFRLAESRVNELAAAVETQRQLVDQFNEDSIQYNILQRESESNKELYEGLLQRLKEAGVAAGLRSSNIRVADPAAPPRFASSPRKARALALALVLGLFLGLASAFGAEALDNTIKNIEDISIGLGLPSLGLVPRLGVGSEKALFSLPRKRNPDLGPRLVFGPGNDPQWNRALEAYRSLRTALLLSHSGTPPRSLLITSATPSEGKTTTALNLAVALAQTGARTVIVDLDLRKPSIGEAFELSKELGMSSYLSGNSELSPLIQETVHANLFAVCAGPVAPNPAELIGSERMSSALELLKEHFRYVVIDSPPALELADALVLSPRVDGVMVVARAGKTQRRALTAVAARILQVGGTLLGVVLNDVPFDRSSSGYYGYGYSGYYGSSQGASRALDGHTRKSA